MLFELKQESYLETPVSSFLFDWFWSFENSFYGLEKIIFITCCKIL